MQSLPGKVKRSLQSRQLVQRDMKVLVAVSGGVDSVVLLHVLVELSREFRLKLEVAHFNHRLRGRSSDDDERFVSQLASKCALPFHAARGDVKVHAKRTGNSIEMSARELRHAFLANTARRLRCNAIALAHHADDQVELFFVRLLRGAAGRGIAGMKWRSPSPADSRIALVRPLLDVPRKEIEFFAKEQGLKFREDSTNAHPDFLRNRIRLELLPLLRRKYQPGLEHAVLRLMEIIGDDAEVGAAMARDWLKRRRLAFERLPVAVQRSVLELQLHRNKLLPDFDLIESLRLESDTPVMIAPEVQVHRDASGILKLRRIRQIAFRSQQRTVELKGKMGRFIFERSRIDWRLVSQKGGQLPERSRRGEVFDADKIGTVIVLRRWQPGDRFQPIGMRSPVKLQDWFTNRHVPRDRRHELLIATTATGEIFWVQDQRIGERFKLTSSTKRGLHWHWNCS